MDRKKPRTFIFGKRKRGRDHSRNLHLQKRDKITSNESNQPSDEFFLSEENYAEFEVDSILTAEPNNSDSIYIYDEQNSDIDKALFTFNDETCRVETVETVDLSEAQSTFNFVTDIDKEKSIDVNGFTFEFDIGSPRNEKKSNYTIQVPFKNKAEKNLEKFESSVDSEMFVFNEGSDVEQNRGDSQILGNCSNEININGEDWDVDSCVESEFICDFDDDLNACTYDLSDIGHHNYETFVDINVSVNGNVSKDSDAFQLKGNRIVNINNIFEDIKRLNSHSTECNFNNMTCTFESKRGYKSSYLFVCAKCGYTDTVRNTDNDKHKPDLNYAAVLGAMSIGVSYTQLNEFSCVMDIPSMTNATYYKTEKSLHKDIKVVAEKSMDVVAEEEKKFCVTNGHFEEGRYKMSAYADTAWCKRSYGTKYSALSGSTTIVGYNTKKVLWNGVANKTCRICKNGKLEKVHDCNINYVGPSTGMEPKLMKDGFSDCEKKHDIRFTQLIADGDSGVISELNNSNVYKDPMLLTEKIECSNHLKKNAKSHLRIIARKAAFKPILTDSKINQIVKDICCARKHWSESGKPLHEQIINLRQDIYNAPYHVFGSHDECAKYFCKGKRENETNLIPSMEKNGLLQKIQDALARMRQNAKSLLINENTNIVEQFNSLIVKYTGNKRTNFASSRSFEARVRLAVIQRNTGKMHSTIFNSIGVKTNDLIRRLEEQILKQNERNVEKNKTELRVKKPLYTGPDKYYGTSTCQTLDMDTSNFEFEKSKFLKELTNRHEKRISIENNTKDSDSDSTLWKTMTRGLIIASDFGRICVARSPESFTTIVDEILHKNTETVKQSQHDITFELKAIRALETSENITVKRCGLIIDEEHISLCAAPAGLVGDYAIVMIRCPLTIYGKDASSSLLEGEIAFWKKERKKKGDKTTVPKVVGINENHKWYYQIQKELHVTQRKLCYFAMWTGDDTSLLIEKIARDDNFWTTKMQHKLLNFHENALMHELVDSRRARHMSIRKYDKEGSIVS